MGYFTDQQLANMAAGRSMFDNGSSAPAPAPTQNYSSNNNSSYSAPEIISSPQKINALYQKYFERNANINESSYWQFQSLSDLEKQLQTDYKNTSGIPYDGSPIQPGQTKTVNQMNSKNKTETNMPIGSSAVNHLFKLYLGRDAYANELSIYQNHTDDKQLRSDLEMAREKELAKQEQAAAKNNTNASAVPVRDGNLVLVKFSDDPTPNDATTGSSTVWIYNSADKSYRAFLSPDAIKNFLGATDEEINKSIVTLPTTALDNQGWQGTFLPKVDAIQNDGKVPGGYSYDSSVSGNQSSTSTGLNTIYGKTKNTALEQTVANMIGAYFTTIKLKGGITQDTFNKIVNDPANLAKYINALAYGGYTPGDIYRDVKAKELASTGNTQYNNFKGFDESVDAANWYNTDAGKTAKLDANTTPNSSWDIDMSFFNNPIFSIPGAAFSTLRNPIDWNSDEFKEEASKIQASYYDLMEQKATAETEQEKALADSNWELFKKNMEKNYGIKLSNNANSAWNQLQQMFSGANSRGLSNSGIMQEAMDNYLRDVRRNDQLLRDENTEKSDLEYRNYLLKTGTPEQISAFVRSNPDKAKAWGIVPSDDVKAYFDYNTLKEKYPSLTEDELKNIQSMLIDENGNYRSTLYQNLYSNKYNLGEQKKTYQQQKLYEQKLLDEDKAYAPYTQTNPFSSYSPDYAKLPENAANEILNKAITTPSTPSGTITPANAASPSNTAIPPVDTKWQSFKTQYGKGLYQAIPNGSNDNYYNIQNPGSGTLYGIPLSSLTKVTSPSYLSKYKADQIYKAPDKSIYLTPGTTKLW